MNNRLLILTLSCLISFCAALTFAFAFQPSSALSLDPAQPKRNRIVNLYDAFGEDPKGLTKDWGYSALVEYNSKRILFDAGNNADVFKNNVRALGIDLRTIDFAVISQPYTHHLSGFDYLVRVNPKVKIYLPDDVHVLGAPRKMKFGGPEPTAAAKLLPKERYYGTGASEALLTSSGRFYGTTNVQYVSENLEVAPGIHLIATRSPYLGDLNAYPPKTTEEPALNGLPELSLALQTSKGEVLVVGCSHTGVEKIVQATKTGVELNVDTVVGGLHLFPCDRPYRE